MAMDSLALTQFSRKVAMEGAGAESGFGSGQEDIKAVVPGTGAGQAWRLPAGVGAVVQPVPGGLDINPCPCCNVEVLL